METYIVINDLHIPYHDPTAIKIVGEVIEFIQPTNLLYLGDVFDFPGLTTKFRRTPEQQHRLSADLKLGLEVLNLYRSLTQKADIQYIEGNHEARLRNYITDAAEELAGFTGADGVLSLPRLLDFDSLGIRYYGPYGEVVENESFVFKHGDRITKYAASSELSSEGSSGMSGHTHRLGAYFNTTRSGAHAWYENGCLCHTVGFQRPPATTERSGPYNWQQGMSIVGFHKGIFNVNQVVITRGRCIVEGKVFE